MTADMIYANGRFTTFDPGNPVADAGLVSGKLVRRLPDIDPARRGK